MKHHYIVQWDNGSYLQFTAGKHLSMAELQFCIFFHLAHATGMRMPDKLADKAMANYSIVACKIDPEYWRQYPAGHII